MVKTLGYGSVPVGLIEHSVRSDENGWRLWTWMMEREMRAKGMIGKLEVRKGGMYVGKMGYGGRRC